MNRNIAIVGASYLQLPLILKAKEMGYTTHVFAWAANDVGEKEADFFYPISITENNQILEKCKEIGICGICSIASDLAMLTVNYVAEKMGLTGNSLISTMKSTNKHLMRRAFEANGDPSPKSILVDTQTDISNLPFHYPLIVKPTDRSGSRGIFKVANQDELDRAVDQAIKQSFEKKAVVEEFAEGKEYSVEFISYQGMHYFLALTQKYTTGAPHFIETGHRQPAVVKQSVLENIISVIKHALNSLEISNGASHSEIKIADDDSIQIIEIGARMGGDCIGSDLVRYSTGYDFVKMVIDVACGKAPDFTKVSESKPVAVKFIFTQDDFDEYLVLSENHPGQILKLVYLETKNIGCITDSSNRAGCYIISLDDQTK